MKKTRLTVLGCTGSIGTSTLDVVAQHRDRYEIFALCAHRQIDRLFEQCCLFQPQFAVLGDKDAANALSQRLKACGLDTEVLHGVKALIQVSEAVEVDVVMAAIVGAAGLPPTLAAAKAGKRVLLANKESLVMAGELFMSAVREAGAALLPIDSEHNAIFQCLPASFDRDWQGGSVRKILLTASGGPFRHTPLEQLRCVTPEQACAHPRWVMGRKISVDSASMMNKGLEVIEAHWLFSCPPEQIQVVVHPQSIVHSLVEYIDGSVLAQLGNPDMRTPIAHALAYPARIASGVSALDLFALGKLEFEAPDHERFPCLGLAYDALRLGGTAPAVLNAANEVAVEAFLSGRLSFLGIPRLIEATMQAVQSVPASDLALVFEYDRRARAVAEQLVVSSRIQ